MTLVRVRASSSKLRLVTCPGCGAELQSVSPKSHLLNEHSPEDFGLGDSR